MKSLIIGIVLHGTRKHNEGAEASLCILLLMTVNSSPDQCLIHFESASCEISGIEDSSLSGYFAALAVLACCLAEKVALGC